MAGNIPVLNCAAVKKLKAVAGSGTAPAADSAHDEYKRTHSLDITSSDAAKTAPVDDDKGEHHLQRTHTVPARSQSSTQASSIEPGQRDRPAITSTVAAAAASQHQADHEVPQSIMHPSAVPSAPAQAHEHLQVHRAPAGSGEVRQPKDMQQQHHQQQQQHPVVKPKPAPKPARSARAAPIQCTWNMVIALLVVVIAIVAIVVLVVLLSGSSSSTSDTDTAALLGSLAIGMVSSLQYFS
mgnify:CR=1 FL=1